MAVGNDKIKDLFASKLGSFEPEVPASVWGGLDQLLSNMPIPSPDASSLAPDPSSAVVDPASSSASASSSTSGAASVAGNASIIKTVAITAGLAAAVVTGVVVVSDKDKEPQVQDSKAVVTDKTDSIIVEEEMIDSLENTIVMPLPIARNAIAAPKEIIEDVPEYIPVPIAEEKDIPSDNEAEPEVVEVETMQAEDIKIESIAKKLKGFSVRLTANGGLFSNNSTHTGGDILFSRGERSTAFMNILDKENSEYRLKHKQPISFGLTVSKELTPRLSLETGLVYTHLSSEITSNSIFHINETQSFDYLGIPLSLNYTFYELGKAKFYLTVGGMVQKDIKGKYISKMDFTLSDFNNLDLGTDFFYDEPYYIKNSIKQSNPQFSVHTSLGIAYPLYKKVYLYGTFGGAYYFDADNKYRTIYSDKKTQLNLNLGIKFDF